MQAHIWLWFMFFTLLVFVMLWICQFLLQHFYDRMKTADIIALADEMLTEYEKGDYQQTFTKLAVDNDMCIEVRDRFSRHVWGKDVMGINCVLHGLENDSIAIIRALREESDGVIYGTENNPKTNMDILIYACVIGDVDDPQGYLLLNTPLVPVSSTVSILRRQLFMITIVLTLASFAISMLVSKRLSKPIVKVTKDAEHLAHGRYDIVFEGGGYAEAEQLAQTLTYASHEINRVDTMQRDLIANASHDLRTPLTMLKAYAEMIRDLSGDNPVKRNEHLQIIIEETDRLTLLVNDILDLSKLENGSMALHPSEFDMEQRLQDIIARYRALSNVSGYQFFLQTDGTASVCCDSVKIEQVICNLLNNAMNYTGEDKIVFVTQEHTPQGLKISVRDTGEGMDQDTISRIFDKYYRSENYKREVVGTGLGLSIVKAILRLHDYAFGVDSTVGVGTTFWFLIHNNTQETQ